MQQESAEFAQRVGQEFRLRGLAGVLAVPENPNVIIDISLAYPTFSVVLTGDRTLSFVGGSEQLDRRKIILEVVQGTTGGWSLTPDSSVAFGEDLTSIDLSMGSGRTDVLGFVYIHSLNKYRLIAIAHGY